MYLQAWYHSLRAKGDVRCKMLWFPEDHHAIDGAVSEGSMHVETVLWLQKHVPVAAALTRLTRPDDARDAAGASCRPCAAPASAAAHS